MRALFVWFRVAREHEAAVVAAVHELHGRWIAQGLHCELLRRADGAGAETTLMEIYGNAEQVPRGLRIPVSGGLRRCKSPRYLRVSLRFAPCSPSRYGARRLAGTCSALPYRAAGGVDAHWQERIEREANERLAPWLSGARHVEVFEPVSTPSPAGGRGLG